MTPPTTESHKMCWRCERQLPLSCFRKDRSRNDGLADDCSDCVKKYMAHRWQQIKARESLKRKEAYRNNRLRHLSIAQSRRFRKFGVNLDWYDKTLAAQAGRCGICGSPSPGGSGRRFHIDHDHTCCADKQACDRCRRGLLCNRCNLNLGIVENLEWNRLAKIYLDRYCKIRTA
jgi:hypothetical protein